MKIKTLFLIFVLSLSFLFLGCQEEEKVTRTFPTTAEEYTQEDIFDLLIFNDKCYEWAEDIIAQHMGDTDVGYKEYCKYEEVRSLFIEALGEEEGSLWADELMRFTGSELIDECQRYPGY
ncbi:MAG TPA: hypothetical protein GX736_01335 [Mogibacterium sp.]|nr:hypothetical protein [Mogibacterium sp.]